MNEPSFGAFVPQGFMLELAGVQPDAQWPLILEHAREIERLGYDSLWVSDHLHNAPWIDHGRPSGTPRMSAPVFECWSLLAALSQTTTRVRLGQLTTANSFRPPALLAKIVATVDVMSGGRVELGIGSGWFEREHLGYGMAFPSAGQRIRMLGEALQVIRSLWTEHEVTFHGTYYDLDRARCSPKPLQQRVPLLVGGSGPTTLKVVAQSADKWNFIGRPEDYPAVCARLREACDAVGRDFDEIGRTWFDTGIVVARSEPAARRAVEVVRATRGVPVERTWLSGTPGHVAEVLGQFVDLGITEFVPQFGDSPNTESLQLFAEEVIPVLRPSRPRSEDIARVV